MGPSFHRSRARDPGLWHRRLARLLASVAFFSTAALPARAQASADEAAIRAAMLLNIARFTDWPAWKMDAEHTQFLICILGVDPIDHYVDKILDHQAIDEKPIAVRRLKPGDSVEACHILYTSVANRKLLSAAHAEAVRGAVLTVSELSNNIAPDQIIGLPIGGDHVRIEVNLTLAQRSSLRISSRVLRLASVTQ
jgi:hypothetical protein